jgi:hypothetical protein
MLNPERRADGPGGIVSYQNASIAETIDELSVTHFLPAIQREFVWDPDRVVLLFDSILRRYPIGSLLFWKLRSEHADRWEFYDFVKKASQAGCRAETANIVGIPNPTIVLDGQQRLTALFIGLRGSYTIKKKHMRWSNPAAWEERFLYLDLLKDPEDLSEEDEGLRYGLAFLKKDPECDSSHYHIPVAEVLRFDSDSGYEEYRSGVLQRVVDAGYEGDMRIPERNLDRLRTVIWLEKSLSYYVETDQDYDRVLDIFVRANQGAVKLSKSDLLLSMMVASWAANDDGNPSTNARAEVYGFVDYLNGELPRRNDFDKDFVMKSCLVLCDLPVAYQVKNFNKENLERISTTWGSIKSAVERAVRLANHFGIDRDTLTSANALIPVAYYFLLNPTRKLIGSSGFDDRNARLIHRWLASALLNMAFSGQSDRALTATRQAIKNSAANGEFPVTELNAALDAQGRRATFDETTIDNFLHIRYGQGSSYLALSLLHDTINRGGVLYHEDHIFPRSWFTPENLARNGIEADRQVRFADLADTVGNLQLLTESENLSKNATDPLKWMATRADGFRESHLIPVDDQLLSLQDFESFVDARQRLIANALRSLFSPLAAIGE